MNFRFMQLATDVHLIERFNPKAQVSEVRPIRSRRCATYASELAIARYRIKKQSSGTSLNQADGVLAAFGGATQYAAVQAPHLLQGWSSSRM